MNKMKILLTGSTSGIGKTLATQLLEEGHDLYLPVRNIKTAIELFSRFPNAHPELRNLEDYDDMVEYAILRRQEGVVFDYVLPLVGNLVYDDDEQFAGETKEEKLASSIEFHERVNVLTAQTVVFGLQKAYGELLKQAIAAFISSWALAFELGDTKRVNEEGYISAKTLLEKIAGQWKSEGIFKDIFVDRAAFVITPLTERIFPDLIINPEVPKQLPEQYIPHFRKVIGL